MVIHIDLRKMFITLVWNDQRSFYPAPLSYKYPSCSFFVCQILIHVIAELQYNHVLTLYYIHV